MKTNRLIIPAFWHPLTAVFLFFGAVFLFCGNRANASLALSPGTIANDYTGTLDFAITGLDSAGQTVIIEEFLDGDGTGTITGGDILLSKFSVTDGQVVSLGGQRNLNIPGDEDGTADSQIHTRLLYGRNGGLSRIDGLHIFRVSPSAAGFAPFTTNFIVTQKDYAGSGISGTVMGGSPQSGQPGSVVLLQKAGPDGETVAISFAGIGGSYSIKAPPGAYQIIAAKSGFICNFGVAPTLTVTAGNFLTSQTVTLTTSQRTISGQVRNATSQVGLPGLAMFGQSQTGYVSVTLTNASGNFVMDATSDPWQVEIDGTTVARLGMVGLKPIESSPISVTGFNVDLPQATALIYGSLKTPANVPLPFADIEGSTDGSPRYRSKTITDANGNYTLNAINGTWNYNPSASTPGYIFQQQTVTVSGSNVLQNLTAYPVTTHLTGTVKDRNGTPIGNLSIGANTPNPANPNGQNLTANATTDANGNFDLGVFGGTAASPLAWNLYLQQTNGSGPPAYISGNPTYNVVDGVNQTGIIFTVYPVTAQIIGSVKDADNLPITGVQVFGNATVGGTEYSSSATTNSSGNYSLPVFADTWSVGVSSDGLQAQGYLSPANQSAVVSTGNVTLNFVALRPTATIYGSVKTPSNTPMPFVQVSARKFGGGGIQINGLTDANGNYTLGVIIGSWDVGAEFTAGYVPERKNVIVNTNGSNVLQNLVVHPVTAHLRGQVRNNHNNPVGNIDIIARDSAFINTNASGKTDANGNFDLSVYGGEGIAATKEWTLQLSQFSGAIFISSNVSFAVQDGVDINGITYLVYVVTAHLRGQVLDENNAPIPSITIGASNQNPNVPASSGSDVDATGHFDIPVFGGTWGLGLSNIQGLGLIQQQFSTAVTDNFDQNNLVFRAIHTTAAINGTVKDTNNIPISGVQVFASTTVAGSTYFTSTMTNGSGNYSLPVFSGTWDVGVSGQDLAAQGYQAPLNQNAFVNSGTVVLNFVVMTATATTVAATGISSTGATLNGTVNPGGLSTAVTFDYGLTSSYGSSVAAVQSPLTGSSNTAVSVALTSLAPGTYHFRVRAVNSAGTANGGDLIFIIRTPVQSWRLQYFGSIANSGDGADFNDYDRDGIPNIVEFAFGLHPRQTSASQMPQGLKVGSNFVISFPHPAGVTGVTYGAEWNPTLSGAWIPVGDSGTAPQHTFSVPIDSNPTIYLRLTVTVP